MQKNFLTGVLASVLALGVSACAGAPGSRLLDDLTSFRDSSPADAWQAGDVSPMPPQGDWVSAFNDPMLVELIGEALANNADLQAAEARLAQATAAARGAGAARLPTVNASVDRQSNEFAVVGSVPTADVNGDGVIDQTDAVADPSSTTTAVTISESNTASVGLVASWELDLWGDIRAGAKAGAADAAAADANYQSARLSIAGAVARAWYDLVQARQQTQLAEDEVATLERSLRLTERRFQAGLARSLDVRLARSSLASSRANLIQQKNLEANAARALEVLLGRYPSAQMTGDAQLPVLPVLSGAGAPGDLLARRPDIVAAENSLRAAGLRASQARKALLPSLTLTATYTTDGDDFSEALDPDFLVTRLAGSLLQPVFNGGALRAEARRNEAAAQEQLANYIGTALAAFNEAEGALDAEGALALREEALAEAAQEALAAEELAEREYALGVGTIFELLDAQTRRINAQRQLIQVRRDRVVNRVTLYVAIGGDFLTDFDPTPLDIAAEASATERP